MKTQKKKLVKIFIPKPFPKDVSKKDAERAEER